MRRHPEFLSRSKLDHCPVVFDVAFGGNRARVWNLPRCIGRFESLAVKTQLIGTLLLLTACNNRPVGEDWSERVTASCTAMCEVVTCDPNNALFYEDPEGCTTNCIGAEQAVCSAQE